MDCISRNFRPSAEYVHGGMKIDVHSIQCGNCLKSVRNNKTPPDTVERGFLLGQQSGMEETDPGLTTFEHRHRPGDEQHRHQPPAPGGNGGHR